jgi:hypothetical protein
MIPDAAPVTNWQFRKRQFRDAVLKLPFDGQWNRQLAAETNWPLATILNG